MGGVVYFFSNAQQVCIFFMQYPQKSRKNTCGTRSTGRIFVRAWVRAGVLMRLLALFVKRSPHAHAVHECMVQSCNRHL